MKKIRYIDSLLLDASSNRNRWLERQLLDAKKGKIRKIRKGKK